MTEVSKHSDALFVHGPFPHFSKTLGLFRPVGFNVGPRAFATIAIGWLPLVILVAVQSLNGGSSFKSFILDIGVHCRSLVAAPLFVLCELACLPRLDSVAQHFLTAGLVEDRDRSRFQGFLAATRRLLNSTVAEILAVLIAYLIAILLVRFVADIQLPDWYRNGSNVNAPLSFAGWWYALVSLPLLLILFIGWIWRVILWSLFLMKVARLKLRLVAAHPDKASGLKFLNTSIVAFMSVAFTLGVIAGGSAANRVANQGAPIENVQKTVIVLVIFVLVLFVSPLLVFTGKLFQAKISGIFHYDQLADAVGRQFEEKWLADYDKYGPEALSASDFSATTDLYQIVANVHEMTLMPFDLRGLIKLVVATALPFVPVALMAIPLKVLVKEVASLLF